MLRLRDAALDWTTGYDLTRGWITANVTLMAIRTDKTRTNPTRRGNHTIHRYAVAWRITIALPD